MCEKCLVPKLRFKEFTDEWESSNLKDVCLIQDGTHTTPSYTEKGVPFFSVETITSNTAPKYISKEEHLKLTKRCKAQKGDILLTRIGTLAQTKLVDWNYDFSIYVSLALLSNIKLNAMFLNQYIQCNNYQRDFLRKSLLLAVPQKINLKDLKETKIKYPITKEQEKIASFLSSIDKKIDLLKQKLNKTQDFKKYLLQNIFSQKLRFKNENGEDFPGRKTYNFGDLIEEVSEKSVINNQYDVLSSTKEKIVLQSEYFDRDIASNDNTGYKILRKKQMVLSPQNLWMGNININFDFNIGLVSPSYKIYNIDENIVLVNYINFLIKTPRMLYEYECASEQGASVVRRNLNKKLFNEIKIIIPSIEEQNKISNFLLNTDTKINLLSSQIVQMEKFKKGLLQQMFI